MLELPIFGGEYWDEDRERFVRTKSFTLQLEHSLVSLSKWETITQKPFLGDKTHSYDDTILYIKCMTVNHKSVDEAIYGLLTANQIEQIQAYIDNPMTATWFNDNQDGLSHPAVNRGEVITSELIYYWMVANQIPAEYQKWHLNRLLTLLRICNLKNAPPKKMSQRDRIAMYAKLNEERCRKLNTRG